MHVLEKMSKLCCYLYLIFSNTNITLDENHGNLALRISQLFLATLIMCMRVYYLVYL
jgi:hypothetical protein